MSTNAGAAQGSIYTTDSSGRGGRSGDNDSAKKKTSNNITDN